MTERLPESWVPPEHVQEIRTLMRVRHSMVEERSAHLQRIHAQLFHNGCPKQEKDLLSAEGRERLQNLDLPGAARKVVGLSLAMIEHINEELEPIEAELRAYARAQTGCRALMGHYGVGELTSVALCFRSLETPVGFRVPARRCASRDWISPSIAPTRRGPRANSQDKARRC